MRIVIIDCLIKPRWSLYFFAFLYKLLLEFSGSLIQWFSDQDRSLSKRDKINEQNLELFLKVACSATLTIKCFYNLKRLEFYQVYLLDFWLQNEMKKKLHGWSTGLPVEIWWNLMKFDEIWWNLLKFVEITNLNQIISNNLFDKKDGFQKKSSKRYFGMLELLSTKRTPTN